jgi:membrane-associated phospholipid phosphatase
VARGTRGTPAAQAPAARLPITIAAVRLRLAILLAPIAASLAGAPTATAQQPATTAPAESRQDTRLLRPRDAALAGTFLAGAAAISIFDARIARYFGDSSLAHVRTGQQLDDVFTLINETTLTAASIATWGIGRLAGNRDIADIGLHSAEAIFLASIASQLVRGPLGRSRPDVTGFQDQYDFHFGRGFREFDYRAFPSIHSASGFAAASVVVAETHRRSPGNVKFVAPVAYGLALTPGLARLYLGKHWASDVFMGAFVGTFAGWRVVSYSHDNPDNRVDRALLGKPSRADGLRLAPTPQGMAISWSHTF